MENTDTDKYIEFDKKELNKFKEIYNKAVKDGKTQFTFEGNDFLTLYAKYVIQYLEEKLK